MWVGVVEYYIYTVYTSVCTYIQKEKANYSNFYKNKKNCLNLLLLCYFIRFFQVIGDLAINQPCEFVISNFIVIFLELNTNQLPAVINALCK